MPLLNTNTERKQIMRNAAQYSNECYKLIAKDTRGDVYEFVASCIDDKDCIWITEKGIQAKVFKKNFKISKQFGEYKHLMK